MKYPFEDQVLEIVGSQTAARQCLVAAIQHRPEADELVEFLRENADVFAWNAYEASGIDPSFTCHHLNVNPSIIPKRQPLRRPSKKHAEAVRNEVAKLKQAGAIKEVFYP